MENDDDEQTRQKTKGHEIVLEHIFSDCKRSTLTLYYYQNDFLFAVQCTVHCARWHTLSHTHTPSTQPNGTFGQIWRMHSAVIAWALGAHHIIMHTDSAVHLHLATTTLAHILQCWPKKNKNTHTHTAEWVWAAKLHWIPYMMEHCGIIWLENAWMHFWNTSEN